MTVLHLTLHDLDGARPASVPVQTLIIAGWTGRDLAAVQAHIDELAALGVTPPLTVPVYYRAAASRLTMADHIQVTGPNTSGEAEFALLRHEGRLWVLAGSDHTDRTAETYDVTVSKQMCDKPVSAGAWALASVAGHWDQLRLRSWADGVLYQDGPVSALLGVAALIAGTDQLSDGTILFGGTVSVLGGIRHADTFRVTLADPVLNRSLTVDYLTEYVRS